MMHVIWFIILWFDRCLRCLPLMCACLHVFFTHALGIIRKICGEVGRCHASHLVSLNISQPNLDSYNVAEASSAEHGPLVSCHALRHVWLVRTEWLRAVAPLEKFGPMRTAPWISIVPLASLIGVLAARKIIKGIARTASKLFCPWTVGQDEYFYRDSDEWLLGDLNLENNRPFILAKTIPQHHHIPY